MDNVQKHNIFINVPSSQTSSSYGTLRAEWNGQIEVMNMTAIYMSQRRDLPLRRCQGNTGGLREQAAMLPVLVSQDFIHSPSSCPPFRQSSPGFFQTENARVEACSNTSTIAQRVVQGDEKGAQCLGYNRATLFLGDVNTGTWPSRLGESRISNSKIWS
jgi:hypothetical protein